MGCLDFISFVSNIFCTDQHTSAIIYFPSVGSAWATSLCSSYYSFFSLLFQRLFANVERAKIDQEIAHNFEIQKLSSSSPSNTLVLADMGCATGPNTFGTMQHIVKSMKRTFQSVCPTSPLPEFQVFFNDQVTKLNHH